MTDEQRGVYLLAVYEAEAEIGLGPVDMGEKAHELSVAPALLDPVDGWGTVVTGDALFTQPKLSEQVVACDGA